MDRIFEDAETVGGMKEHGVYEQLKRSQWVFSIVDKEKDERDKMKHVSRSQIWLHLA